MPSHKIMGHDLKASTTYSCKIDFPRKASQTALPIKSVAYPECGISPTMNYSIVCTLPTLWAKPQSDIIIVIGRGNFIKIRYPNDVFVERDGWAEQTRAQRESLGYDTAPPLERMLIEYACVCGLRLAVMEVRYSLIVSAQNTLVQVEHTERRLTEAQNRFNRACESLARVRKLSRPNVQINVAAEGGRQLNVA